MLYLGTFVWGVIGTGTALAMIGARSMLDVWWQLAGVFSGGMLGLFLLGILCRPATGRAAAIGVVAGVAAILWMTASDRWPSLVGHWRSPLSPLLTTVLGTLAILAVGGIAACLRGRRPG